MYAPSSFLSFPFQLKWKDEKNEKIKESIRKKITEYLDRAEKLKECLNKPKKTKALADGASPAENKLVFTISSLIYRLIDDI